MKSENGGENWTCQGTGVTSSELYDIEGLNQNQLTIVGDKNTLLYTLDGGNSWHKSSHNLSGAQKINSLNIVDQSHAWAVGASGIILFSADAGINWSLQNSPTTLGLDGVHFKDVSNGYVVGQQGTIFETTDGGANWISIADGITNAYLKSITITPDGKVFACGYNGIIVRYGPMSSVSPSENYFSHDFYLSQNYPNPFNENTNFHFQLPRAGHVTIAIYNLSGQLIITLVNETKSKGSHPVTWNADHIPSGVYFIRMKTENFSSVRKALLIK